MAPRLFHEKFSKSLNGLGFTKADTSLSLFIKNNTYGKIYVIFYLDDILFIGYARDVQKTKGDSANLFKETDLEQFK